MTSSPSPDLIDHLLGTTPGSRLDALRDERRDVRLATQAALDTLLGDLPGLSLAERLLAATQASRLADAPEFAETFSARLDALDDAGAAARQARDAGSLAAVENPRLRTLLTFVRNLTTDPTAGGQAGLRAVQAEGLSTPDIVALSQLLAFLSYQLRVAAGLRALASPPEVSAAATPDPRSAGSAVLSPALDAHPLDTPLLIQGYTDRALTWRAWLDIVDPETATPEQIDVLKGAHPKAFTADYYRLLVHQPEALRQRQIAFNAIMYAPRGLPRAERELSATVASRANGCVYCASVHAERFEQLAKRNDVIAQVFTDPDTAGTTPREAAIVQASLALTRTPGTVDAATVAPLHVQGLTDLEILDLVHVVAVFGWANRLMLNLGGPETLPG